MLRNGNEGGGYGRATREAADVLIGQKLQAGRDATAERKAASQEVKDLEASGGASQE
jgi:hypothetical protein